MSRKILFTLAAAATIAAAATLASSAADAHGFGGGGFGGGHFGGGGFARGGGFGGSHFGGTHFGGSRFAGTHFGGRGIGRGYPGRGWGRWAGWHHRWYWRDGRWFYGDYGVDGGYVDPAPVATPGPCTCLTKTRLRRGRLSPTVIRSRGDAASAVVLRLRSADAPRSKNAAIWQTTRSAYVRVPSLRRVYQLRPGFSPRPVGLSCHVGKMR